MINNNDYVINIPETKKEELPYDLSKIVNTLPEKYKTIIILHYYDDMKIKDISNGLVYRNFRASGVLIDKMKLKENL